MRQSWRGLKYKQPASQHFLLTNDQVIRSSLIEELNKNCGKHPDTNIIEELGIDHGAARIDIAVVNGCIHGYELKSERDTLCRLPNQIKIYNSVLDKVTLVVGKNHLNEAMKIIPDWWGITIAKRNSSGEILLLNIREAEQNPKQDSMAIAALLWREEALGILEEINQASGIRSKSKKIIYERLAQTLSSDLLKERVRKQLCSRPSWRSGLQYMPSGG